MNLPAWTGSRWFAAVVAVLAAAANSLWLLLDRGTPAWDQGWYLYLAVTYQDALADGGVDHLWEVLPTVDASRGPFYVLAVMPLMAVLGNSVTVALLLNMLLAPVLYLTAGEIALTIFRSAAARLLTIVLVAGTPIVVGLQHEPLQDFLLITLASVAVLCMLRSDVFLHRGATLAMGLAMGLGALTKVTFPAFVAGPVLVMLVHLVVIGVRRRREAQLGRRLLNLVLAGVIFVAVAALWYARTWDATLAYIESTTNGPLSVGVGPEDPLTLHNVTAFTLAVVNNHLSWVLVLVGALTLLLNVPSLARRLASTERLRTLRDAALLGSWFAIPFLALVTGHNQDVRLMAPAFVAYVVALAGGLVAIRPVALGRALVGVTVLALVFQTVNRLTPVAPGWLPDRVAIQAGSHWLVQPVQDSTQIGYLRLPKQDRGTPIFRWLEQHAPRDAEGRPTGSVCLLATTSVVNYNTFSFLNGARDDTFTFRDVLVADGGEDELLAALEGCTFALHVPMFAGDGEIADPRLAYVNGPYASSHMTRSAFRLFDGPSKRFPIWDASRAPSDAWPVTGTEVRVLSTVPHEAG